MPVVLKRFTVGQKLPKHSLGWRTDDDSTPENVIKNYGDYRLESYARTKKQWQAALSADSDYFAESTVWAWFWSDEGETNEWGTVSP